MAKILLAEDDESMRVFLEKSLTQEGHEVSAFMDGLAALDALKANQNYDLLLTDIVMPGMDGIELSKKAKKMNAAMKIVFMTGFTSIVFDSEEGEDPCDVIQKPFHLSDITQKIDELLAK